MNTDLDHVPSDDPPGADSSPMSELQRRALGPDKRPTPTVESAPADVEEHIANAMQTWSRDRAIDQVVMVIATGIADCALDGYSQSPPQLARYAYAKKLQDEQRGLARAQRTALAEHTQPAIQAIEAAATEPDHGIDEQGFCAACEAERKAADPFAGIPNADDSENRPL